MDWGTVLDKVEYALNNIVKSVVGEHPSVMLFCLGQRGPTAELFRECVLDDVGREGQTDHFKLRQEASTWQKFVQDYKKKYYDKLRRAGTECDVGN